VHRDRTPAEPGETEAISHFESAFDLHVEADKDLPAGIAGAFIGHRPLRLDERVVDRLLGRNHRSEANSERHAAGVVLEVIDPDRRSPQIAPLAELVERERLKCAGIDVAAPVAASNCCASIAVQASA